MGKIAYIKQQHFKISHSGLLEVDGPNYFLVVRQVLSKKCWVGDLNWEGG